MPAVPKVVPVRYTGNALRTFRFLIFARDKGRCVKCKREVSFNGKRSDIPPMHLSHKRNKRMWGDSPGNCETMCPECHLVGVHLQGGKGKICPPKVSR